MKLRLIMLPIFAAAMLQAAPRVEFENIAWHNIGKGLDAIKQHDFQSFEESFKSITGYALDEILTEEDPDLWSIQLRLIELFYGQSKLAINSMAGAYQFIEVQNAFRIYRLLEKWFALKAKWNIQ